MGKAERTREHILEKTAPVFNRKGFAGTSLSDLTQATGLTKGAIYGNFENKDEVGLAAFDYNMTQVAAQLKLLQRSQPTAIGKIRSYLTLYRQGLAGGILHEGCPIINTGTEADDTHPRLQKRAADLLERWSRGISVLITQGIKQGEIRDDVDIGRFASLMIAMIEGGITVSKISGDDSYLTQSLDHLDWLIDNRLKK